MTRRHRFWHRVVWPLLAALVALGFSLALLLRPAPAAPAIAVSLERTA